MEYGFVLTKESYIDESIHEIRCICFSPEKANDEAIRLQNEIDPKHHIWKITITPLVEIVR